MADPAQYQAYTFRPTSAAIDGGGRLIVKGTVRWRLGSEMDVYQHLSVWEQKSYKTGLTIGADQDIHAFSYLGESGAEIAMQSAPLADVRDLEAARGVQDGY